MTDAEGLARELLAPSANRWVRTTGPCSSWAAWWRDLGYAPALLVTGAHQIDGARDLAAEGYPARLVALVAHHSAAICEADGRGLAAESEVWPRERSPVADALWMADMTTGPRGEELAYDDRLSEILNRYEPDSIVGRAMLNAEPAIRGCDRSHPAAHAGRLPDLRHRPSGPTDGDRILEALDDDDEGDAYRPSRLRSVAQAPIKPRFPERTRRTAWSESLI